MDQRAYWHSDPDALIAHAAQALKAKRELGWWMNCSWEYVDAHLGPVLLEAVKRIPERNRRRRREDRRMLGWVSRLVDEVPHDDPSRIELQVLLRERL